jgi:hypothetical protein
MCQIVLNGKTPGSSWGIAFAGRMLLQNCLAWGGLAIKPCFEWRYGLACLDARPRQ